MIGEFDAEHEALARSHPERRDAIRSRRDLMDGPYLSKSFGVTVLEIGYGGNWFAIGGEVVQRVNAVPVVAGGVERRPEMRPC
jgi:hypothetical protein